MSKESFLEKMGLIDRSSKKKETEQELELRNRLINDFNEADKGSSFGFVSGSQQVSDGVTVEDLIPRNTFDIEKEFAFAAEEMKHESVAAAAVSQNDTAPVSQNDTVSAGVSSVSGVSGVSGVPVEEAAFEDAEKQHIPYKSQIAEKLPDGELKVEESKAQAQNTYKPDPFIGEKLDLIIGQYEKNRLLTIDEIYKNARLETDTKKTIFMTDVFLQAIPANLPPDVKRETVLNILRISGIEMDTLLSDAYKRIDSLNKVLEETVATSNDIFQRNESTIRELERRIQDLRDINSQRHLFQEDQNTMIQYEIQKIINLVEFVKPKNL